MIVAALTIAAYAPILRCPFMADDGFLLVNNPYVHSWSWANVRHDFLGAYYPDGSGAYYRPLQAIYLRTLYTLAGLRPVLYHFLNIVVQVGNGWNAALLLCELGASAILSWTVACFFVVHPLAFHEMAAASQTELIATLFLLIGLRWIIRPGRRAAAMSVGLFALALLWKESAVLIPFLALLIYRWIHPDGRRWPARLWAMLALLVPYAVVHYHVFGASKWNATHLARFALHTYPRLVAHAARVILFPWKLQTWPPLPGPSAWDFALGAGLLLGFAWLYMKGRRAILFAASWYLLNLSARVPAMRLNLVRMDHWIYPASFSVLLLLAAGLWAGLKARQPVWRFLSGALLVGIPMCWIVLSQINIARRGSDEKDLRWTLRWQRPTFAVQRLGIILWRSGRTAEALPLFAELAEQFPDENDFNNAYALVLWDAGRRDEAMARLRALLAKHPAYEPAQANLRQMVQRSKKGL